MGGWCGAGNAGEDCVSFEPHHDDDEAAAAFRRLGRSAARQKTRGGRRSLVRGAKNHKRAPLSFSFCSSLPQTHTHTQITRSFLACLIRSFVSLLTTTTTTTRFVFDSLSKGLSHRELVVPHPEASRPHAYACTRTGRAIHGHPAASACVTWSQARATHKCALLSPSFFFSFSSSFLSFSHHLPHPFFLPPSQPQQQQQKHRQQQRWPRPLPATR
jgi:hypothetical protein